MGSGETRVKTNTFDYIIIDYPEVIISKNFR